MNNLITAVVYLAVVATIGVMYYIYSSLKAKQRARFEEEKAEAVLKAVRNTSRQYERRAFLAELKAKRQLEEAVDRAVYDTTMLYDAAFKEAKGIKVTLP